jgi:dihydroorotate dehydrogenase (fumarate)
MADLKTTYLGLDLKNPLIVSSSALTNTVDKIVKLEEMGAGAVVLKSIFEEQFNYETSNLLQHNLYPEAGDYILNYAKSNALEGYYHLIENAKAAVKLPVIASINCVTGRDWTSFAKKLEMAGADALELNIHLIISDKNLESEKIEEKYLEILRNVVKSVKIPVSVKIGHNFSNLANMVNRIYAHGGKGVVLFNRFYEPDIDIENMQFTSSAIFSTPSEIRQSLRWVGLLSALIKNVEISSSTGVHDHTGAIKMLLAGAQTVQVCSTLYKNGVEELKEIVAGISAWIDSKGYKSVNDIRGLMNYRQIEDPSIYERAQFMKYFSSVE